VTTDSKGRLIIIGSYLVALVMDTERIPMKGETILAKNFRTAYGGKGSDMAVQAARLGADVHFVGSIGDDDFGRAFRDLMVQEGVNIDHLTAHQELATGAGFIIKSTDGHNIITIDIGANQLFSPEAVDAAAGNLISKDVMLIQLEIPLETALHAAQVGHDAGATVILNPAPAYDLREVDLSAVDILTPNETELRVCLGMMPGDEADEVELARRLLEQGCQTVLVTLGERGSMIVTADDLIRVPAFAIDGIIDSNGAGDSFNASLSTALLNGLALAEAARFGNAVAGLCCTRWDTVPSYHIRSEVDAFLASQTS
jgi:ribokinase